MRTLVCLAALGVAAVAGAQTPATPTPATQAAPAPAAPKSGGGEFRVGGFMISGDRSIEFGDSVRNTTGGLVGLDVVLRAKAIGLQFKSISGKKFDGQPNVTSADLRLLLFPPVFTVMVGAGRRALWSDLTGDNWAQFNLGMVGISSTAVIGGSGLRTNFQAAMYLHASPDDGGGSPSSGNSKDKGFEGEASVMWRLPKMPLYVQAGYRTEIFTSRNGTPEEVRGMKLGGGMVFGGR
jgi:hypothetical protein